MLAGVLARPRGLLGTWACPAPAADSSCAFSSLPSVPQALAWDCGTVCDPGSDGWRTWKARRRIVAGWRSRVANAVKRRRWKCLLRAAMAPAQRPCRVVSRVLVPYTTPALRLVIQTRRTSKGLSMARRVSMRNVVAGLMIRPLQILPSGTARPWGDLRWRGVPGSASR